jgi:hypothetical protein
VLGKVQKEGGAEKFTNGKKIEYVLFCNRVLPICSINLDRKYVHGVLMKAHGTIFLSTVLIKRKICLKKYPSSL